jgi:cystathionine beta-synthase
MKVAANICEAIGNTPLVRLNRLPEQWGVRAQILAKVEYMNPGGSMKDRIGLQMLLDAEKSGALQPGGTVIECTSGNTGVGLALAAIVRGYRCIFVMPDKMSREKIDCLRAYGAEVITCPTAVDRADPRSYYSVAARLTREIPKAWHPNQYFNESNPKAHYLTTAPEIWRDTDGKLDVFVAGVGTGGTITGISRYLKERKPGVKIVGVDPEGSMYFDKFYRGVDVEPHTYLVEGIGEDFYPSTCDLKSIDDFLRITDVQCYTTARKLTRLEGIFTGSSGGAAVWGALEYAKKHDLPPEANVVVLIPDHGLRYLSKVYSETWLRENGMLESQFSATAVEVLKGKKSQTLVSVPPDAPASKALQVMKEYGVSQIPVIEGAHVRGSVLENQLVELIIEHRDPKQVKVSEIMQKPFPVVAPDTRLEEVATLLKNDVPAVLVRDTVGNLGIITKYDLIAQIAR